MVAGPKLAFMAMLQYIIIGLAGIPIFANGGGPAYVLQPTFGFLIGFLISTIPNGIISQRGQRFGWYLLGGLSAMTVYFAIGSIGFWLNMNHIQGKEMSYTKAVTISVLPFIVFDLTRLILAAIIAPKLRKMIKG
jgi:biotin transport system substrate-specific component